MQVELSVCVDGREVARLREELVGTAAQMEEQVQRLKQRAGRVLLEHGFEDVARRQPHPRCCGRRMENRGRRSLTVQTLDGEVYFERTRYRCRQCRHERTPADEEVLCGRHRMSRGLAQRVCQLATLEHFPRLEQLLADQHGVFVSRETMLELVHDVGQVAETERRAEVAAWQQTPAAERHWPEAEVRPKRVYVSLDGIMYCTNQREPDPKQPGQRRLVWQQMKVGCVYWQDEREHWHKQVVWGRESPAEFGASLYRLACRCGYREAQERIFAADGADWCWEVQLRYFADATGILDWFHASEHVWAAARAVRPQDAAAAKTWADEALTCLRQQGGTSLEAWLVEAQQGLRGGKRTAVANLLRYVRGHVGFMNYPAYRAAGYQIGTGMIESTARQLVGQRLKGPGMHWTEAGAVAVTALRAQDLNGHWHRFWQSLILVT